MFAILLVAVGCKNDNAAQKSNAIANINGNKITRDNFVVELHNSRRGNTESLPTDPVTWLQIKVVFLDQFVERVLIEQEASRRQIAVVEQDLQNVLDQMRADWPEGKFDAALAGQQITEDSLRKEITLNLLTDMLSKKVVLPDINVSENDVRSYYRSNSKEFARPEQVRAKQILIRTEAEAAEILTRILTGSDFAEAAKEHSIAPEAGKGGDLGYFGRNQMPKIVEDVCFALERRQTSDIIKSEYGYHLFRLEDRRPATVVPLNNARPEIIRKLRGEKLDAAWAAFLDKLKSSANIVIDEQMLASIKRDEI